MQNVLAAATNVYRGATEFEMDSRWASTFIYTDISP